jgi:molecular chaperone GrpE
MRLAMTSNIDDIENEPEALREEAAPAQPDPVEKLQAENSDLKDRVLRTLAEMENLRKRTEKEVHDSRAYAVTSFARDIVSVADNLERALASVPADAQDGSLKSLAEGVEMTGRQLSSVLSKHGITRIEPKTGDRFDPNLHEAIFEVPDPSQPANSVVHLVQAGFSLSGRLLRPAQVGVSKGGAKMSVADTLPSDSEPSSDNQA